MRGRPWLAEDKLYDPEVAAAAIDYLQEKGVHSDVDYAAGGGFCLASRSFHSFHSLRWRWLPLWRAHAVVVGTSGPS